MPRRLASPCAEPLCPRIAVSRGRCAIHKQKSKPWQGKRYAVAGGRGWQRTRARIFERDDGLCRYCGGVAEVVDHIVCRARGGSDDDANLVAACKRCNERKRVQEARAGRTRTSTPESERVEG
jgi:5-methylcytosine-specific restriction protein A